MALPEVPQSLWQAGVDEWLAQAVDDMAWPDLDTRR